MDRAAVVHPTDEGGKPIWRASNAIRQDALSARQVMRLVAALHPQAILFYSLCPGTTLRGIFRECFRENAPLAFRQAILDALIEPEWQRSNVHLFEIPFADPGADEAAEVEYWATRICGATGTDMDHLSLEYRKRVGDLAREIAYG